MEQNGPDPEGVEQRRLLTRRIIRQQSSRGRATRWCGAARCCGASSPNGAALFFQPRASPWVSGNQTESSPERAAQNPPRKARDMHGIGPPLQGSAHDSPPPRALPWADLDRPFGAGIQRSFCRCTARMQSVAPLWAGGASAAVHSIQGDHPPPTLESAGCGVVGRRSSMRVSLYAEPMRNGKYSMPGHTDRLIGGGVQGHPTWPLRGRNEGRRQKRRATSTFICLPVDFAAC